MDTSAFHNLTYGLYVICALDAEGRKVGCIANTFAQVANDPVMVCVSLNKDNVTAQAIRDTRAYTASCLTVDATMDLIGRFGFNSSYNVDKFDGTPCKEAPSGIPYVTGDAVNSWFGVEVDQTVDVGSHVVFIGRAVEAETTSRAASLTYEYYHTVLKGKTPPKAVSFIKDDAVNDSAPAAADSTPDVVAVEVVKTGGAPKVAWRCTLCGYIEEGYPDGLPEDYKCPWCGAGAEMFERIEI